MIINSYSMSDIGMKRDHNEDYHLTNPDINFYVVCDGMGGHAAGEVASKLVAHTLNQFFILRKNIITKFSDNSSPVDIQEIKNIIREAVRLAVKNVLEMGEKDPSKSGMGTTMAMALFIREYVFIAHIGDSRVYLYRAGEAHQVTEDHSLVNEFVKQGILTREEAQTHPRANVITRAIGTKEIVEPDIIVMETMVNDFFLLCSDGLSNYMKAQDLGDIIKDQAPKEIPNALIMLANSKGGKDNITAVVAHCTYSMQETLGKNSEERIPLHGHGNISADKKVTILKKIPLFKTLTYLQVLKTLEIIRVRRIPNNQQIIAEREPGDEMFIILSGKVEVYKDKIPVKTLGPGQFFGEMSLIDNAPRSASIYALEDCILMVIKRDSLYRLFSSDPRISTKIFWAFLQNLNNRLRDIDQDIYKLKVDPFPPLKDLPFLN